MRLLIVPFQNAERLGRGDDKLYVAIGCELVLDRHSGAAVGDTGDQVVASAPVPSVLPGPFGGHFERRSLERVGTTLGANPCG
jgi:hypothetical protein